MSALWSVLAISLAAGTVGSFVARGFARRLEIVNHPNPLVPQHVRATPYLGGVGVLIGISVGVAYGVACGTPWPEIALAAPALLFCLLGVVDDLFPLAASRKLVAQFAIAGLAVFGGSRLRLFGLELFDSLLAVLWIVACVNAFNVTDVCDGLITGLAAVFFVGAVLFGAGNSLIAVAALGACLGFLPFNAPRASMFLGDAGSHLLGFLVAALALDGPTEGPLLVPLLVLSVFVPLAELAFVTAIRVRKGMPWYKGSPDHFALRLQEAGWSRWRVDLTAWLTMAGAFSLAPFLAHSSWTIRVAAAAVPLCFAAVAVPYLLRHEVVRRE